jgi:uncharacterized protein
MKHGFLPRALLAAALLLLAPLVRADVAVPQLRTRVTDLTSTLSGDQVKALEGRLAALEAKKGSQVAVLLLPTTQPETVEQYAIRVFDQWKLGRKGVDDGVLLVIAKNDRRLRIEVGRGLEGAIPDAYAKRIIDEDIAPHFRQGDFYGGVSAGVDRIAKLVDGEPMPPPKRAERRDSHGSDSFGDHIWLAIIVAVVLAHMLQSVLGRMAGSGLAGIIAGGVAFIVAGFAVAVIAAIAVFIISLFSGQAGGGGWSSGGYSGGGWSSGDSGGFSGGGGESGGGGASGSW